MSTIEGAFELRNLKRTIKSLAGKVRSQRILESKDGKIARAPPDNNLLALQPQRTSKTLLKFATQMTFIRTQK